MRSMFHPDNAIGLVARNSVDYVRRFFDCLEHGVPVVLLRSSDDADRIRICGLEQVVVPADEQGWCSLPPVATRDSDALAQIAFTSGTEGEPKGVLLTHGNLADTVQRMLLIMGLDASVREYICVPVYHAFGFGRCRAIAAAGGRFYVPPRGFDLRELAVMIDAGEVNSISSVPTLLRLVLRNRGLFEKNASRVRWIEIGSQAMASDEKRELRELFPQARIVQHYGLTEASRTTLLDVRSANDDELDSVGTPCGAVEIGITNDGRIKTRGPHVARELLVAGQRVPNTDAQGWFVTQDLGECRNGRLYFRGRADDVINLGGLKVSPDTIESEMRTALGLTGGFCVARVADALRGEAVLVAALDTLAASDEALVGAAGDSLAKAGVDARSSVLLMRMAELPATDAGKIKRKVIAQRYVDRAAPPRGEHLASTAGSDSEQAGLPLGPTDAKASSIASPSTNERILSTLYSKATGRPLTDMSATLRNAGADSLSIVQIRLDLDRHIDHVPDNWIDLSIRELASRFSRDDGRSALKRLVALKSIDVFIVFRALAILSVVAHHFHWFIVPGGSTTLLFVIGGYLYVETNRASLFSNGKTSWLWSGLIVLVATLVPITAIQALGHTYFNTDWHITLLIPYENLSSYVNDRLHVNDTKHHVHWLWFIHVYIQVFFLIALALSFSKIRRFVSENPYEKLLACFFILELLSAAVILTDSQRQDLGHSAALLQYAPTTIFPVVIFGALLVLTKTRSQYFATALAGISYSAFYAAGVFSQGGIMTLIAIVMMLFVRTIRLPAVFFRPVMMVSEASLFIYLIHMPFQFSVHRFVKWNVEPAVLSIIAIVVSVFLWNIWRSVLITRIRGLNI